MQREFHALYVCGSAGTSTLRQRGHFHSFKVPGSARSRSASFTQREFHAARAQLRALHSAPLHREPHEFQGSASFISRSASCTQRGHSCTRESCRLCTAAPQFNSHSHRRAQKHVRPQTAAPKAAPKAVPGHVGGERVCRIPTELLSMEPCCRWPAVDGLLSMEPAVEGGLVTIWPVARGVARAGFLGAAGLKRGAGLQTRVGRPAAGSTTWHHVLVRLHTRFVRCALLTLTYSLYSTN